MVDKFRVKKQKKILCCIVDNFDLCQSGWAREISTNLTDFLIHRFDLRKFDIYISKNENELLLEAANSNDYSHAVVMASGTSLGLSDRLFSAIEKICKNEFFIAGHILDRKDRYWEMHHQFYIVNIAEYKNLGCPLVDPGDWFTDAPHETTEPARSEECLYNDPEVPVWLKPGTNKRTYTHKLHGWNIVSLALDNNKILMDLGPDIRNNKTYAYFEYDHVFLSEISKTYYNQFFCNVFFASWNSDELPDYISMDVPVEQYVTVGIGLNWIKNLIKLNYTNNTKVIFTDINYHCLQYMKELVTEWDGGDYPEFYKTHMGFSINRSFVNFDTIHQYTTAEWNKFRSTFDDWDNVWNNIKKLKFEFIPIDYTSDYEFGWIEKDKATFMNISDLFNHSPFMHTLSLKYRVGSENRLLNRLQARDPNIMLLSTTRAASGFYPTDDRVMFGAVSSFDRTDMNILKTPDWHKTDWPVLCSFTGQPKMLS